MLLTVPEPLAHETVPTAVADKTRDFGSIIFLIKASNTYYRISGTLAHGCEVFVFRLLWYTHQYLIAIRPRYYLDVLEEGNMKRKIFLGTILGVVAGIIDIIPMMIQKLPIHSTLSAFSMWVVLGFIINTSALKINGVLKGLLLSFLVILPTAILIAQAEPISLIPISIMTVILGILLGFISDKIVK